LNIKILMINQEEQISRREFLKWGLKMALAFAGAGALSGCQVAMEKEMTKLLDPEKLPDNPASPEIQGWKDFFYEKYSLKIKLGPLTPKDFLATLYYLKAEELDLEGKKRALAWLREVISKYPPELIRNSQLKTLRLVESFRDNEGQLGGLSNSGYMCLAVGADFKRSEQHFHHELYHILDYSDGGFGDDNQTWANLNPAGKKSYTRRWDGTFQETIPAGSQLSGFVNDYARIDEDEDQAVTGQLVMSDPKLAIVLSKRDPVLAAKIKKIKEDYYRWSGGKMNDVYWRDLAAGLVKEGYWE
jgi:hypothetical protein